MQAAFKCFSHTAEAPLTQNYICNWEIIQWGFSRHGIMGNKHSEYDCTHSCRSVGRTCHCCTKGWFTHAEKLHPYTLVTDHRIVRVGCPQPLRFPLVLPSLLVPRSSNTPSLAGSSTACMKKLSSVNCRNFLDCVCWAVLSLQQIPGWLKYPRRTRACDHKVISNGSQKASSTSSLWSRSLWWTNTTVPAKLCLYFNSYP